MLNDSSLRITNSASISTREVVVGGGEGTPGTDTFKEESRMNLRMVGAGTGGWLTWNEVWEYGESRWTKGFFLETADGLRSPGTQPRGEGGAAGEACPAQERGRTLANGPHDLYYTRWHSLIYLRKLNNVVGSHRFKRLTEKAILDVPWRSYMEGLVHSLWCHWEVVELLRQWF